MKELAGDTVTAGVFAHAAALNESHFSGITSKLARRPIPYTGPLLTGFEKSCFFPAQRMM